MIHRYRRHERFSRKVAADPAAQIEQERARMSERDFALDCLDFVEGRDTEGAARAKAEHDRLRKQVSEAKRRALVGADPLNLTGHSKRAKQPARAGMEGRFELGHKCVKGPYSGEAESVRVNIRHDVLEHMHARRGISDAEKAAGDRFVQLCEMASIGGARAVDYSRTPVDGGGIADTLSEQVMRAAKDLAQVRNCLGETGMRILEMVLVSGLTLRQVAATNAYETVKWKRKRSEQYIGRRFKEALADLALLWAAHGRKRGKMSSWMGDGARAEHRPDLHEHSVVGQ